MSVGHATGFERVFSIPEIRSFLINIINSSLFSLTVYCSLDICEEYETLLTSSVDCTVRMWTLNGHFIGERQFLFLVIFTMSIDQTI